jgi:hypothetical protein
MTEDRINILRSIEDAKRKKAEQIKHQMQQRAEAAARNVTQIISSRKSIGKLFRESIG